MAIITEEPEEVIKESPQTTSRKPMNPKPRSSSSNPGTSTTTTSVESSTANVFMFWAYFTLAVSIITLFFVFLSSLTPQDDKSWFLSLPNDLRSHYSKGRTVKVHLNPNRSPIEVFSIEDGPKNGETVVLVHGLGCSSYSFRHVIRLLGLNGIHAVGIDLPGSGFSDKTSLEEVERWGGPFGKVWDIYNEIKEKGLFWGFDHLVETGNIPYDEYHQVRVSTSKSVKPLELNSEEMGRVIGQVIDTLGLSPVHLVLHDSALGMSANWVAENSGSVSSLTLIDSSSSSMALPLWVLQVPLVRELVLGFSSMYVGVLQLCCSKSIDVSVAEAHRVLLKGRDGRRAVVGTGRGLNCSFDIGDWASSEGVKGVPVQVLWSRSWSEEWSKEGRRVADALQQAKFIMHPGGRWPQEDAAEEITESITRFVSSLPKTVKQMVEEPLPEHIKKMFEEGEGSDHHHGHDHDHGSHGHDHAAGYMDAYGLGHGWGS